MLKPIAFAAAAIAALLTTDTASAATQTFDDRATYLAAGGDATNYTTPTFNVRQGTVITFDILSITSISRGFFTTSTRAGIAKPIVFSDRNGENFNASFAQTVFGFGFDVLEPVTASICNVTRCVASTFSVTLFDGSTEVGSASFTPNPSDTTAAFFGIQSTLGFNAVQVRETTGTNDNEYFGNFVSTAAPSPVPLPAAGWMLVVGVSGMVAMRRRGKKA